MERVLANFTDHGKQLRRSYAARKQSFKKLFPYARIAILRAIYEEADGKFPHDFDPVVLMKKVRLNGHRINSDLFWGTFKQFGIREKCSTREGSFNIEHHFCTGKVPLRRAAPLSP